MSSSSPLINLRMAPTSVHSVPPMEKCQFDHEMADRVNVMLSQEMSDAYQCKDYMSRRKTEQGPESPPSETRDDVDDSPPPLINEIDTQCREKMCEWAYRVVDHFSASREIVAIAFSCLDRFVDRCYCDRAAFKLAAMTSIYMATKVFNSREISMSSLSELSRGEFNSADIAEMERIILSTLKWRMHPPTVQSFIDYLLCLIPMAQGKITKAIYKRATLFGELSLFDYSFVTQSRSLIAIAALINAMEGMEGTVSLEEQHEFYEILHYTLRLQHGTKEIIDSIRNRLWYLYSQSAQYLEDEASPPEPSTPKEARTPTKKRSHHLYEIDQSPVCVSVVSSSRRIRQEY